MFQGQVQVFLVGGDGSEFEGGGDGNRKEFIAEVIRGKSKGRQAMARVEGMGSRLQVEIYMPVSMAGRSAGVISVNEETG